MKNIAIQTHGFRRILHLISDVMDVRTTFFDIEGHELSRLDVKDMSPFCCELRKKDRFQKACHDCDLRHLAHARESGEPGVYRCHAGLLEAMVPLHDRQGRYLGAIVFGQLRPPNARPSGRIPKDYHPLFRQLPTATESRVRQMAELLRLTSEAIIENEFIRLSRPHWADVLRDYIEEHLSETIQLHHLADAIDRSPSFVSHHFPTTFGQPPIQYILHRRLERGRQLLQEGRTVSHTAHALGFCDPFHFSKAFRKHYGISPAQYIKEHNTIAQ